MMINDERVSLMDIAHRLRLGVVASCNCNTKTSEIQYHNELCPTRLLEEGANEIVRLRAGLKFYADGGHMLLGDPEAWDTVSGEPQNWYCDEEGTATIEDGTIAKQVLVGHDLKWDAQGELTLAPLASESTSAEKQP
jgi:hypothetical protein